MAFSGLNTSKAGV